MISVAPKTEQARATEPSFPVFSLRCGVSETNEAGIAIDKLLTLDLELIEICLLRKEVLAPKMNLIALNRTLICGHYAA